jgi:hypothetical protein
MADLQKCTDLIRLSDLVGKAVASVYAAKLSHDLAAKQKKDAISEAFLMAEARKAEHAAVKALDQHRKEHRC